MSNPVPGRIVAGHGRFAHQLIEAIELILGAPSDLRPFDFQLDETAEQAGRRLQRLVRELDGGAGVLIMADLFGGTPGSLALSLVKPGAVEVVTGVNLAMALTACELAAGVSLREAADLVENAGRSGITSASGLSGGA